MKEPRGDGLRRGAGWGLLGSVLLWGVFLFAFLTIGFPFLSKWITSSSAPHPVPSVLFAIYAIVACIGLFLYVTSSEDRIESFVRPIRTFLSRDEGSRTFVLGRKGLLIGLPVVVGFWVFQWGVPKVQSPTSIRIQHPTMPGKYEGLQNPFRTPGRGPASPSKDATSGAAGHDVRALEREGTVIYEKNCRPCHGVAAGGDGPMARFFRLRPANFRDPGFIATVVEAYAFWRVAEGGPGLPPAATPWDSAMPVWKADLTEVERWKVILAEYAISGVEPRKPEKME